MAHVERKIEGFEFADWLAHEPEVHSAIKVHTARVLAQARIEKSKWKDEGHSFVEAEIGDVDGWVILNDERGQKAAMAMEYGADPSERFPDGTPAQLILHKAAGIPFKLTHPRKRRNKKYVNSKRRRKRSRDRRRRSR